ncbi:MAG: hypothetical protein AAFR51_05630 [Pseudomonadota bacterium]
MEADLLCRAAHSFNNFAGAHGSAAAHNALPDILASIETHHPEILSLKAELRGTKEALTAVRASYSWSAPSGAILLASLIELLAGAFQPFCVNDVQSQLRPMLAWQSA